MPDHTLAPFWPGKRVLLTGGAGFLGRHVASRLQRMDCTPIVPLRSDFDLTEQAVVRRLFEEVQPQLVIHMAAEVGGIGANRARPGRFFYANALMGVMMIEEARRTGVEKFVQLGTICSYPKDSPVPFAEENLWNGYPEGTNAPYGIAKKVLLTQLHAYRQEYGFNGIYLLPVNLYGPGDDFDLETSHVIPALIRKMVEAQEAGSPEVVIWGTGKATREFLYVEDCARAIVLAAERYESPAPVNIGTGREITIAELAETIRELVGYKGRLRYDPSKPDGQPRRRLDVSRAQAEFDFVAETDFRDGLTATIEYYRVEVAGRPDSIAVP